MLRGIRNISENWLGRTVMGVVMTALAASFAVWGINDIFNGYGNSALAKVGSIEIPVQQFRDAYSNRLETISHDLGHPLPPEQAQALGLDRQVLSEIVAQAAIDQQAHRMGLGLSTAEISRHITSNPELQNEHGQFDPARLQLVLQNMQMTEPAFLAAERQTSLRRQLIDSVSGDASPPQAWLDAINQFQNEERSIKYVALGSAQAGDIPQPTDDQLSKYFDDRKIMFRAPEYRKINTITVTPPALAQWMQISDDDIKKAYADQHSRFVTPEKRHIEQIVFPQMADAQAAAERIKSGTSFADIATARGLKAQDIDLGTLSQSAMVDPKVADAAFALKEGDVSAPVQTQFGAVLVTALKIEPSTTESLAAAAPALRNEIALDRAKKEVQDIHDKIEDDRAGGATLEEAAQKEKLPVTTFDVDRSGRDAQGKPAADISHGAEIVGGAFASDVGVDNDPIEVDGGYIWYDVAAITPARDRNLDEVKSQVAQRWHDDQVELAAKDRCRRSPGQAQERQGVRYARRQRKSQDRNRQRSQARRIERRRLRQHDADDLSHRKRRFRQQRRRRSRSMDRFSSDRRQNTEARSGFGERQANREDCAQPDVRRSDGPVRQLAGTRSRHHGQSLGFRPGHGERHPGHQLALLRTGPCIPSHRRNHSRRAMRPASRKLCGRRWSPTWKRRFRPI